MASSALCQIDEAGALSAVFYRGWEASIEADDHTLESALAALLKPRGPGWYVIEGFTFDHDRIVIRPASSTDLELFGAVRVPLYVKLRRMIGFAWLGIWHLNSQWWSHLS